MAQFLYEEKKCTQSFPNPAGGEDILWEGSRFKAVEYDLLSYPMPGAPPGWNDDLTNFHEEISAGRHPIDEASMRIAVQNVLTAGLDRESPRILEIGCSSGFLLRRLRREKPEAEICGADIIDAPLRRLAGEPRQDGRLPANCNDQPSDLTRRLISGSNGYVFKALFTMELWFGRYVNWPFGIRCVGRYVKPSA